jgi:hypothetical protein
VAFCQASGDGVCGDDVVGRISGVYHFFLTSIHL